MKALSLLVQKLCPRLSFLKSRSKVKVKNFGIDRKVLSQGIHLCNIKALSPFVKKLWSRLSLLWTDRQGDSYIPPQTLFARGILTFSACCSSVNITVLQVGK